MLKNIVIAPEQISPLRCPQPALQEASQAAMLSQIATPSPVPLRRGLKQLGLHISCSANGSVCLTIHVFTFD